MVYEWDPKKARKNLAKHRVSFDEATSVFTDPFSLTFDDPDHTVEEKRFMTVGMSDSNRILFLSHVDKGDDHVRIISARGASKSEINAYQETRKPRR